VAKRLLARANGAPACRCSWWCRRATRFVSLELLDGIGQWVDQLLAAATSAPGTGCS